MSVLASGAHARLSVCVLGAIRLPVFLGHLPGESVLFSLISRLNANDISQHTKLNKLLNRVFISSVKLLLEEVVGLLVFRKFKLYQLLILIIVIAAQSI